jgi:hypothetical protein
VPHISNQCPEPLLLLGWQGGLGCLTRLLFPLPRDCTPGRFTATSTRQGWCRWGASSPVSECFTGGKHGTGVVRTCMLPGWRPGDMVLCTVNGAPQYRHLWSPTFGCGGMGGTGALPLSSTCSPVVVQASIGAAQRLQALAYDCDISPPV